MPALQKTPAERLATPIQFLKGVGPERAELLKKLGVETVQDALFYFPRDYQDLTDVREIARLEDGATVSVRGKVVEVDQHQRAAGGTVTGVLIQQGPNHLRGVWFNQAFMLPKFQYGQEVLFSGKAKNVGLYWEMSHPQVQWIEGAAESKGYILPIYGLCEGLMQQHVRRATKAAVELAVGDLPEVFPSDYLLAHRLWGIHKALPSLHFPENKESLAAARRRFTYQELFILQLALALRRRKQQTAEAPVLECTAQIDARIRRLFPFELTAEQNQAIAEISADLSRPVPMNRLLQGDVGTGKTAVAVYGVLLTVAHGFQAALMAPTEVLARQHHATFCNLLAGSRVRVLGLFGGRSASERKELLAKIAAGGFDLVVGTQALIQEDVEFAKLGLVVIDEQHRFGVKQRASLRESKLQPHYLVMTATPIPRTVTMTQYGDLDVSTIRSGPPGRQQVNTYLATEEQREKWWDFFRRKLREGRQGFVVTPLVGEPSRAREQAESEPSRAREQAVLDSANSASDEDRGLRGLRPRHPAKELASVEERFEALANGELEEFRLGLVHGRLSPEEKERQMNAFRRGELQVLVCTTVVEVGVDVPAATLMTIENGEHFGLSQLHQLRGRISRGQTPGYCTVFADPTTDDAKRRLEAFVSTTDGFRLAEIDFEIRGPGDLFGTKQHGLPPFRIAALPRDAALLDEARRDALSFVDADPRLDLPDHDLLRKMTVGRYGAVLELGDVG